MRTKIFFFAMLASIAASAQNVQVETISATYTSTPIVKFRVTWTGARAYRHNTKVWVFIDYRKVENNVPAGSWERALVSVTPTVSSSPTSTATLEAGNNKGFWLHGANSNYSATLTVPLTLAAGVTQFNWCAYVSDYPPNVVAHSSSSYTLRGSPPFVVNGTTLNTNQTIFYSTITSFTDATGAPGIFPAALGEKTNEMGCLPGLVENANSVCVAPSTAGCNNTTLNLGTVSFTSGTEITITGDNISQIWSRPVTATGCHGKTNFNYGSIGNVNADCRNNPGYSSDLITYCAVLKYAHKLCPSPWRVPTRRDFELLFDAAKAKITVTPVTDEIMIAKLKELMQPEYLGCLDENTLMYQGLIEFLHAQTFETGVMTRYGGLGSYEAFQQGHKWGGINSGCCFVRSMPVRCVRDN